MHSHRIYRSPINEKSYLFDLIVIFVEPKKRGLKPEIGVCGLSLFISYSKRFNQGRGDVEGKTRVILDNDGDDISTDLTVRVPHRCEGIIRHEHRTVAEHRI